MGFRIDTGKYDSEIATVVNTANSQIKTAIDNFNTELSNLANGETWIGGSAATNVGQLVGFYNTYKDAYAEFIRRLGQDNAAVFERINSIIAANNGTPLTVDSIESLSFGEPKVQDLSYSGGEAGDVQQMKSISEKLVEYSDTIKNSYVLIKDAFDKIGSGSQILDMSDNDDDPATILKNNVSTIIGELKTVDEQKFKAVIENIHTAAENIKKG